MNNTIKIVNSATLQEVGTKALIKELGITGMLRYLEQYDNDGTGDYTKEKYEQEGYSIDEILNMCSNFTQDDIGKGRECIYHEKKNMMVCEEKELYDAKYGASKKEMEDRKKKEN